MISGLSRTELIISPPNKAIIDLVEPQSGQGKLNSSMKKHGANLFIDVKLKKLIINPYIRIIIPMEFNTRSLIFITKCQQHSKWIMQQHQQICSI